MIAEGSVTDMKHWINVFQEDSYTRKQVTSKIIVVMMIFSTSLNDNMSIQKSSLKKKKKKLTEITSTLSLFFFRNTKKFWLFSITFMFNYNTA